ncbi:MAG: carboxymuconolactone decarboxylase family protein [Sphingomonadales bacterium]|nr:carboxymuconolactone decarboxylase family protein [Sphingomonadales bacterium]
MALLDPAERSARGHKLAQEITRFTAPAPETPYEQSWRDFIYAEIWSRPALDLRSRYLIAIAGAASSPHGGDQLYRYVHGALKSGELTLAEAREAALHLSVYAGWSRGGELDRAVSRVAQELDLIPADCPPIRATPWDPAERMAQGAAEFEKVMTFPGVSDASPYLGAGIGNFVFGEMWCRRGLDERSRRWLTLVGVADSSSEVPIKSHIHAAMASGNCSPEEMQEFVLQYGVHAGWPKASVIQAVVFEMIAKVKDGKPWNG